jgi:hypothetical protein
MLRRRNSRHSSIPATKESETRELHCAYRHCSKASRTHIVMCGNTYCDYECYSRDAEQYLNPVYYID